MNKKKFLWLGIGLFAAYWIYQYLQYRKTNNPTQGLSFWDWYNS